MLLHRLIKSIICIPRLRILWTLETMLVKFAICLASDSTPSLDQTSSIHWAKDNWVQSETYGIYKWYFVTKIVLTYCEKKLSKWSRKTFKIRGGRPRICKLLEITRTIYSNSERSEQFLVTKYFFNLFLEVS